MNGKIVYLMRGLPSCGKSHTARRLAGDSGLVCETDEYFHTQVGDDPAQYDYDRDLAAEARRWNFERFREAVDAGIDPVVVDRGNSLAAETQKYARYAVAHGYEVQIAEPESTWWQELRVLLKYKDVTRPILLEWADRLAALSRTTHRVPAAEIRRHMAKWKHDLTVEDILNYRPERSGETGNGNGAASISAIAFGDTTRGEGVFAEEHREGALSRAASEAKRQRGGAADGNRTSADSPIQADEPATHGLIDWGVDN